MSLSSVIKYIKALDTAATDGSGKTGIAFGSFTAKYLTKGGTLTSLTTETITTLGTYQAPTDAAHIRIKELAGSDPTKGIYEVHFHDTQMAESGTRLWLYLSATGASIEPLEVDLLPYRSDLWAILGTVLTETVTGYLTAAFKKLFDVTTPAFTAQSVNQTGDSFARLGAPAGASIAADLVEIEAETDGIAAIPTSNPTAAAIAAAVRDVNNTSPAANSLGAAVNSAGSAADPLLNDVPGSYALGTAGYNLGQLGPLYVAGYGFSKDDSGSADRWRAKFSISGVAASGVTAATIRVVKPDGTNLIASTAMTQDASTGYWHYYATTTARITVGLVYGVQFTFTDGTGTHTCAPIDFVGRDST